jgi:hypothetical protein
MAMKTKNQNSAGAKAIRQLGIFLTSIFDPFGRTAIRWVNCLGLGRHFLNKRIGSFKSCTFLNCSEGYKI